MFQWNAHNYISLVQDADGDVIRCRWAVGSECDEICQSFSPGTLSGVSHSHNFLECIIACTIVLVFLNINSRIHIPACMHSWYMHETHACRTAKYTCMGSIGLRCYIQYVTESHKKLI